MDFTSIEAAWMGGRSPKVAPGTGVGRRVAGAAGSGSAGAKAARRRSRSGPTSRLRKFFDEIEGAELSAKEIGMMVGVDGKHAQQIASRLVEAGELTSRKAGPVKVYRKADGSGR